jgi:transposase
MLQRLSRRRIAQLASDIAQLDNHLAEIVAADAALYHRYQVLSSMPGVGLVLACTLIALLPELGRMSRKQIAAPVGVSPMTSTAESSKESAVPGGACAGSSRALHGRHERRGTGIRRSRPSAIASQQRVRCQRSRSWR